MCRLFGSRSLRPGGVAHALLHGSNALRQQSHEHPDGWGLAWYVGGEPQVVRSLSPAHADDDFENVSEFVEAATVLAHIRKASVGDVALANTHPFQRGRWLFAHNGTLPHWGEAQVALDARIAPALRETLQGETDSERCFLLFLTHLARRCDPERATFAAAAAALRDTVADVVQVTEGLRAALRRGPGAQARPRPEEPQRAESEEAPPPASTTFLVTDGSLMLATRRGRTLHRCAPAPDAQGRVPWFAISSEDPLGAHAAAAPVAPWVLLAEDTLVGVDGELRIYSEPLLAPRVRALGAS